MDLGGEGELFAVWGDIKFFLCVLLHFVEKNRFLYRFVCDLHHSLFDWYGKQGRKVHCMGDVSERKPLNGSLVVLHFSSPVNRAYCSRIQF